MSSINITDCVEVSREINLPGLEQRRTAKTTTNIGLIILGESERGLIVIFGSSWSCFESLLVERESERLVDVDVDVDMFK